MSSWPVFDIESIPDIAGLCALRSADAIEWDESKTPLEHANGTAKLTRTTEPSGGRREGSKPSSVERSLGQATEMGVPVENDRSGGSGSEWVNLKELRDNRAQALVRKLLAMGFQHRPGKGYWK